MELAVINTLRARDQVGVLASAEARHPTSETAAGVLVTEGHLVAKLVWDLVASTATAFVLRVEKRGVASDMRVRVSPLLLGIVGEIQDGGECRWAVVVNGSRYMLQPCNYGCTEGKWVVLYTGSKPAVADSEEEEESSRRRDDGGAVVLCQEPEWFERERVVATLKWIALYGGMEFSLAREKFLLLHRLEDGSSSGFTQCSFPLTIVGDDVNAFMKVRTCDDNQLLLDKNEHFGEVHTITVIDVEQTQVTGRLCVVSTTTFSCPGLRIQDLCVMRKHGSGAARSFFGTGVVPDPVKPLKMRCIGFSVEEVSGHFAQLGPYTHVQPVNDSVLFIRDCTDNVFICDCNDPTNTSPVVVPPPFQSDGTDNNGRVIPGITWHVYVKSGFLFFSDWSHITVIEPLTGSCLFLFTSATPSDKKKTMEFVVGGATLRARDQLGALALASSTTSRRGSSGSSVGGDVTVTTAATATTTATANASASATATASTTTTSTTTLATEGHVLARLVWDLVASTARSFVVTVDDWYGTEKDECDTKSRCLCARVSPLLLSIVGEVQDRAPVRHFLWVDDTRYLDDTCDATEEAQSNCGAGGSAAAVVLPPDKPVRRWRLYNARDAGPGWRQRRGDGVVVCEEPVEFRNEYQVVNTKWMVILGCGERGGENELLVHRFNDDRNRIGGFSTFKVPVDFIAEGGSCLRFDWQRPDELLLVVVRKARTAESSIVALVIDVEQTHSNGTLCVLSITSWPSPFACLISTFVMRKKSGARYFICTEHIDRGEMRGVAVEETTGRVTPLSPYTRFDPVSDSVFLITDRLAEHNCLLICDCNDPTNPSKVGVSPIKSTTNSHCSDGKPPRHRCGDNFEVHAQSGFVVCTAGPHLRVIEPFTGFCVVTLTFPLFKEIRITLMSTTTIFCVGIKSSPTE